MEARLCFWIIPTSIGKKFDDAVENCAVTDASIVIL